MTDQAILGQIIVIETWVTRKKSGIASQVVLDNEETMLTFIYGCHAEIELLQG